MANSKISALSTAAAIAGTEVLPIVQSSATVKVAIQDLNPGLSTILATKGGTGQTSYAVGDLIYADTTTTLAKLPDVATGNALISGGVGVAPSYGKIGLTTHVSGVLPVANGGTNASAASITAFNNITGYTATGATGTTSTNLVFSTSPTLTTPTIAKINSASATEPPTLANSSGTEYGKTVKAWINANGSTGAIRNSFNCSSFSRSSTGIYTMNFTNAMADADFCVVMSAGDGVSNQCFMTRNASSSTSVTVRTFNPSATLLQDQDPIYLAVFR